MYSIPSARDANLFTDEYQLQAAAIAIATASNGPSGQGGAVALSFPLADYPVAVLTAKGYTLVVTPPGTPPNGQTTINW